MNKNFYYVSNLKCFFTAKQELNYFKNQLQELQLLAIDNNLIFCPSSISLNSIYDVAKKTNIKLGAQNCSSFDLGPYTGEICASSLKELNVKYCIVGHSERRQFLNETNDLIILKIEHLLKKNIIPILCIGETKEQFDNKETLTVLKNQLEILKNINKANTIFIAYEPIWSIGTGITPTVEHLDSIFTSIENLIDIKYKILYGGSVNSSNSINLKQSKKIDGFLIGKASTDFQELKKIVLS